ncbi:MAG TPA: hypothetical protein VJC39_00050 [Candidatus Nanoarchaeia archaeon]|nr:hypothetical protein [Candidatus Nanoarchaeia archaeon]
MAEGINSSLKIVDKYCADFIQGSIKFKEALAFAEQLVEGKLYLVGSFLYGNLLGHYGYNPQHFFATPLDLEKVDVDFLAAKIKPEYPLIKDYKINDWRLLDAHDSIINPDDCGYTIKETLNLNPNARTLRFKGPNFKVDLISLESYANELAEEAVGLSNSWEEMRLQSYLNEVPFTVQSIYYDIQKGKVEGATGLSALEKKLVKVNNYHSALHTAKNKKTTVKKLLLEKAGWLGFSVPESGMMEICGLEERGGLSVYESEFDRKGNY